MLRLCRSFLMSYRRKKKGEPGATVASAIGLAAHGDHCCNQQGSDRRVESLDDILVHVTARLLHALAQRQVCMQQ